MTHIDPTSEALGRIEAKCDNLLSQNSVLFSKVEDIQKNGCIRGQSLHSECGGADKGTIATWGAGAGAAIATLFEGIRQALSK